MKISVVIPVYNAAPYLKACLDSVVAAAKTLEANGEAKAKGESEQRRDSVSVEVICVDDGSTDGSGALLDDYQKKVDSAVRLRLNPSPVSFKVLHQANGGEGAARNSGVSVATGELIAFLDADDTFHPQTLELFARARREMNAEVIRYGWTAVGDHRDDRADDFENVVMGPVDLGRREESVVRFCRLGSATVVSREIAQSVRWTALKQGADMVYLLECLRRARRIVRIDVPLLRYLTHAESASRRISVALITGTCRYLSPVYSGCAALRESRTAHFETCRFVSDFLIRRLYGSWREFSAPADRREVRKAYWETVGDLARQKGLYRPWIRNLLLCASRRRSEVMLVLFAKIPFALTGKFHSLWFESEDAVG